MHVLYNSDNFAVLRVDVDAPHPAEAAAGPSPRPDLAAQAGQAAQAAAPADGALGAPPVRGGYEIVDKFARKEIFLAGPLATSFQQGVQALVDQGPTQEALDEYIGRYTLLAQQPLVLH